MSKVLLITNKSDVTTDFVVEKLKVKGIEFYRFNTEDLYTVVSFTFDFNNNKYLLYDNKKDIKINLLDFSSVYFRRPILPTFSEDKSLTVGERRFLQTEAYYTLEGLYKILDRKFWISKVNAIRNTENKFFQLMLAKEIGFIIPQSLATNIPKKLNEFTKGKQCIIKPVHNGRVFNDKDLSVVYTSELHEGFDDESIQCSTAYVQEKIDKKYDVKVTVVGKHFFATAIYSQNVVETKVDWRKGNHNLRHERIKLPQEVEEKCLKLMSYLNLEYSAIDFVVDKQGNYNFLEINPNGQWAWIEKQTGYNISGALADLLGSK